ncbi:MAG: Crp/Fnr family transcriptional regulator [Clostridiaceae bacterium]|nr:Crp/Fnr family transcriptional regulator [Eubacteriales bacterium]MDD4139279.1 Crp/Fnr family transcriptional regulator [Eubacteriales bacterium]MDD4743283.1 Crp/Fnr family transcriptional regulator [Eubacteriales bacterium]NLB44790.1 Crp/Fnr family transcriptional regulator [Clostridiaceae bacterium]
MPTQDEIRQIEALFPVLTRIAQKDRQVIYAAGQLIELPVGQMLMQQNQQCQFIPLVLTGQLRVYTLSSSGREMTLFRTGPGDTCVLSIACQIKNQDFPALAQVEEAARLFMVPVPVYLQVLAGQPAWKDYIILTLYGHLTSTMQTLEAVAFNRTDRRLAEWLLSHRVGSGEEIACTHEAIAVELGTAREVVSRLLGELKSQGAVALGRGKIRILKPAILRDMSDAGR